MNKKIRTISIIEGSTAAGKTSQILKEYRDTVRVKSSILLSFEEDLESKIPAEEIDAHLGYHRMTVGAFKSLDDLVVKINELIAYRKIQHIFIDSIGVAVNDRRYTPSQYYTTIHALTSSVTTAIQLPRNSHVDNS